MSSPLSYLAIDLGAESGRVMLGQFDGQGLALTEVHRYEPRQAAVWEAAYARFTSLLPAG